jgi:hypothetical protein
MGWNLTLYNIRIAPVWSFSFHLDNYVHSDFFPDSKQEEIQ